jgi:hypothetical protein
VGAPKSQSEPFVRVTLTLRKEDADYLRHLAYAVFVASDPKTAMASLRRGERPSASQAVRFLIDERRRAQKSPTATVERDGITHTATVGPVGELSLSAEVRARPAVATADGLFVLPSPSPSPAPPEGEGEDDDVPTPPSAPHPPSSGPARKRRPAPGTMSHSPLPKPKKTVGK